MKTHTKPFLLYILKFSLFIFHFFMNPIFPPSLTSTDGSLSLPSTLLLFPSLPPSLLLSPSLALLLLPPSHTMSWPVSNISLCLHLLTLSLSCLSILLALSPSPPLSILPLSLSLSLSLSIFSQSLPLSRSLFSIIHVLSLPCLSPLSLSLPQRATEWKRYLRLAAELK